jgi:type I restriction modification DNA specificity domain protein
MSEWKEYALEDTLEVLIDYRGKTPKKTTSGIPLITAKIIKNGRIEQPTEFIAKEDYAAWMTRGFPKVGDVVLTTEAPLGEVAQLKNNNIALAQRVVALRGKPDLLNNDFLLFLLQSSFVQEQLEARSSGSTVKGIKQSELRKIVVKLPNIKGQIKIAKQLKTLDDKIHLNTQTNQTLEHIAQAIYKSWFVDYEPTRAKAAVLAASGSMAEAETAAMTTISGKTAADLAALAQNHPARYQQLVTLAAAFPATLVPTDNFGEIPEGWEYRKANELFDVGIGKTPPRKEEEWFSDSPGNVQWISIKDMGNSGTYVIDSSEYLTKEAVSKFNVRQIPENTVILSFKLTVGRVSITTTETTTNEAIAHFKITNKSCLTSEYLYLFLKNFDFDQLGSTSSIATAVNSKSVKNIFVLCPKKEIADLFQEHISGIFRQIKNLTWENKVLSEARDALLPKLLNGDFQDA